MDHAGKVLIETYSGHLYVWVNLSLGLSWPMKFRVRTGTSLVSRVTTG